MHSKFHNFRKVNVLDACAVLNITSSRTLFTSALGNGFSFCCTQFVHYECLDKPRTSVITKEQTRLCETIRELISLKRISVHSLPLECLNDIDILQSRKKLGKGELSSIAFAKNIQHAFLTDDQAARKLGNEVLGEDFVQTTPQLLGYLFFKGHLLDPHKDIIVNEHFSHGRPLRPYFEKAYLMALEYRLKENAHME
jgi:hypothetical protein